MSDKSTVQPKWLGIDHVQLATPVGAEAEACCFYVGILGLVEVSKPAELAKRGGAWFEAGEVRLHIGGEASFVPARKAHPALTISNLVEFVEARNLDVVWNTEIEGLTRCHVEDPFGNRIELVQVDGGGTF